MEITSDLPASSFGMAMTNGRISFHNPGTGDDFWASEAPVHVVPRSVPIFIGPGTSNPMKIAQLWDRIVFTASHDQVKRCLQLVLPNLVDVTLSATNHIVIPHLPEDNDGKEALQRLLADWAREWGVDSPIVWYYTPMALEWLPQTMAASAVVYDCMDELSMFRNAPPSLHHLEDRLLRTADVVFTWGVSLFEAKRRLHPHVHPFPSGVDVQHFAQARIPCEDFQEQREMPRPRLGFAGVIDERLDLQLLDELASQRPDWQLVMIGPIVKISEDKLPRRSNIQWLGMRSYLELPSISPDGTSA